jgi:hypothetical protein
VVPPDGAVVGEEELPGAGDVLPGAEDDVDGDDSDDSEEPSAVPTEPRNEHAPSSRTRSRRTGRSDVARMHPR